MKKKINISLVTLTVFAVIAIVIGITCIYYNLFQSQVRSDLAVSAKLLKDTHYFESVNIDTDDIDLSTDITELRVTWIDSDGTVLYDNDASVNELSNHMDRPEIKDAFLTGIGESVRRSDTMNKNTFYYAVLLDNGTVLRVATDARSMLSVFLSSAPIVSLILLVILGLCVFVSQLIARNLLKPVETMADNLDNSDYKIPYKELEPIAEKLRTQHADVLSAVKVRQDFTANVSHELKTPLTAISGYAELLENNMVPENHKQEFYREIKSNSDRLLNLINDIIRLSEMDHLDRELNFEEIDLYLLVKDCIKNLEISARQKAVSLNVEGESFIINGNQDLIKELIDNLVQNAIRYNNPKGYVNVSVFHKDNSVVLMVKDNGIGIPAEEQNRIFERFYRVDKSRTKATGGTGLGLSIVKHIVDIHEAKIEVDSTPGVGTTMIVTF